MTKSELKEVIDNQRKILTSLELYFLSSGMLPTTDDTMKYHLENLWAITEFIGESFNLELLSLQEIVKEGQNAIGLNNFYRMNVNDKNSIN
jgi:hypothetical protein